VLKLIARRLGLGLLTLLAVSALIFASTEVLPGDVASAILGQQATPEALAAIRGELGLDRPAIVRYFDWLWSFLHGDLGRSLANRQPIATQIGQRLENTLFLAAVAAVIAVPLAVGLGIIAAIRRESLLDRAISILTLSTISVPEFFVGYLLIILLAVQFPVFPSLSTVSAGMGWGESLYIVALPALTLTLVVVAHMMRMTRAAVIDVLSAPYIEMARLKGLPEWRVVLQHALPNALGPIATVVALNLAYLVVGVVVVEVVFVYPGMGQYMVDAVTKRDVPAVQACTLVFAITYVGLNLTADLLGIVSNPRLRHPR
jgi:peptide/nickel transport system permease protein